MRLKELLAERVNCMSAKVWRGDDTFIARKERRDSDAYVRVTADKFHFSPRFGNTLPGTLEKDDNPARLADDIGGQNECG